VQPQTIPSSQSAQILFDNVSLGFVVDVSPSFGVGNVQEVTDLQSTVIGDGAGSRVIRQYNVTSIEPGDLQARFLGSPSLTRADIGKPGTLAFRWSGGKEISGKAFATSLDSEFRVGELIQWSATFRFSGF
jgi:hypothetical protein